MVCQEARPVGFDVTMTSDLLQAQERSRRMIYLTQLIYIHQGHENDFQRFEDIVLPRLIRYSGELVLRLRPDRASMIAGSSELPYEVHVLRFETEEGLVG